MYRDLTGHIKKISDLYFAYGGFSEVYKGSYRDEKGSERDVAIKIIRGVNITTNTQATIMRRLDREARVWHTLKHPNVLEFMGIARDLGPSVALISPFCANGNISKYIDEVPSANRLRLILDVAKGVEYLHSRDVIHGDIKGQNVLVTDDGRAMLCDFGRSKVINHRGFTTTFVGAARYMAPELIVSGEEMSETGDDNYNPSHFMSKESDVYSFSMIGVEVCHFRNSIISYLTVRYHHRSCLENNPIQNFVTIPGLSSESQTAYGLKGKNTDYPNYTDRSGISWSSVGFMSPHGGLLYRRLCNICPTLINFT
ncbi:hypothetical protein AX15_007832 [Amanita polypyramis BW_CC]|nr:hypothetical protein AX15_007832 [Amanita polypyramis BW_CC]